MSFLTGRTAVLATMHGKEKVIAPILEKEFGLKVVLPENFDTDRFGTFTLDVKRAGNQLETARLKAQEAMKVMGVDLGIASEGSFGADPHNPFIQSSLELIVLIDEKNNIEVSGHHRSSNTNIDGSYASSIEEVLNFAKKIGFPDHGVVVRKTKKGKRFLYKGITTETELKDRAKQLLRGLFTKKIYVETDMRAHMNPTRMRNIIKATDDLVSNIKSQCPECKTPGFSVVDVKKGLRCSGCGLPTDSPIVYVKKCQKCACEKEVQISNKSFENPAHCNWCNP